MNTSDETALHVVLGAGQIGSRVADTLLAKGARVRVVRQGEAGPARNNLEWKRGDVRDLDFAADAMRGATHVYDTMNPAYHQWPELLLPIARGALHGAAKAGAKLIALDCLYMYGRPQGLLREDSPIAPCSKKGELRAELSELRLSAHRRGDIRLSILRASDFFGSNLQNSSFGDRFFHRILAGKSAEVLGDPDMPHSYAYADDVARGLITLGGDERALGQVWFVPHAPAGSTRELMVKIGHALGVDVKVTSMPKLLLRTLGIFSPLLREMVEMTYQWEVPFVVDDSRFRKMFGEQETPIDRAVAETAAWAERRYRPERLAA